MSWSSLGNSFIESKKLGLYIKNPDDKTTYDYIINFIEHEYYSNIQNDKNFRDEMISYFKDKFYKNNFPKNIERLNSKQLVSMIARKTIILDIETSENTIPIDDEVFDLYEETKNSEELQKRPLLNPIDEYEIEYKILFCRLLWSHVCKKLKFELIWMILNAYLEF